VCVTGLKDGEAYWLCKVTEVVTSGKNKGNFRVRKTREICSGLFHAGPVVPLGLRGRMLHAAQGQLQGVADWRLDLAQVLQGHLAEAAD
jgi:hypothetical protein